MATLDKCARPSAHSDGPIAPSSLARPSCVPSGTASGEGVVLHVVHCANQEPQWESKSSDASPFGPLYRLLIKGIRSFSPENTAVLQFDTPLTLIVGQNGAGKTVRRHLWTLSPLS